MPRPSHAARRAAPALRRDFPLVPTLPAEGGYDGLAFVLPAGAQLPDLRPLRDDIAMIRHGSLGDEAQLLVIVFLGSRAFAPGDWPAALRLRADGSTLRSFAADTAAALAAPAGRAQRLTRIELWWAGARQTIAADMLAALPIASLWDLPAATLHHSRPLDRAAGMAGAARAAPAADHTPVSHASVPDSEAGTAMREMAQDLRDLPGRDRIAGMAAKLRRQLATRMIGQSGGYDTAPPRAPGMIDALFGWLRWHTPLGEGLKRQFGERMDLVDKLIASGEIDRALQLALMLGGDKGEGHQPPTRYPNQLPQARASLDLDPMPAAFTSPILGDASFHRMRGQYLDLARKLERDGDVQRAAFIHSQLLGDHREAALVLERGERFAEAARFALGARLDPVLTTRLLYRAGELDTALALAKRTGCFEALAADSEGKHGDYHAYVVRAWTDLLVATGQPLRAIQVTDRLAKRETPDSPLHELRRGWLAGALDQSIDSPDGELTARALLTAQWDGADIDPRGLDGFPDRPAVLDPNAFQAAFDTFQAAARGEGEGADELLLATLAGLARFGDPDGPDQACFWRTHAPAVFEGLARAVLAVAAARIVARDLDQLHLLLHKARLPVLAEDLGKLRKLHRPAEVPGQGAWRVSPALAREAAIRHACLIASGTILIWREDGRLQLLDRNGTPVWQASVTGVAGLVPIGSSPAVLLLQREADGIRLTRFASDRRAFHPIGKVDLRAHHLITSESQWLVQIGGLIGALDLARLCAAAPAIEFAWSCSLTERLQAIAFAHRADGASWITCDISPDRAGILERWTMEGGGKLDSAIGTPVTTQAVPAPPPGPWFWDARHNRVGSIDQESRWMIFHPWSDEAEARARDLQRKRVAAGVEGLDTIQSCDLDQPFVRWDTQPDGAGQIAILRTEKPWSVAFALEHDPGTQLRCLARGVSGEGGVVQLLLADEAGRLLRVEPGTRRVTIM